MGKIFTDTQLQSEKPAESRDKWLTEGGKRGEGKLLLRVCADGAKRFYYRAPADCGTRSPMRIGLYDPKGKDGYTLKAARRRFNELEEIRREHGSPAAYLERKAADEAAEAARRADEQRKAELERSRQGTLGELLKAYVEKLAREGKAETAQSVENLFRLHVREAAPDLIDRKAVEIQPADVHGILQRLAAAGRTRQVNKLRSYLLAAFNYAATAAYDPRRTEGAAAFGLESNPVALTRRVREFEREGNRALTSTELAIFLRNLDGVVEEKQGDEVRTVELIPNRIVREFLRMALYLGGQRIAQLARLKRTDVNTEAGTIRILDSKGRSGVARDHLLPLTSKVSAILAAVPVVAPKRKEGDLRPAPGWVFTTDGDTSLRPETVSIAVTAYSAFLAKHHKLEPFTARDIRRTCETRLAELGVTRDIRAQLLSHGISGVQAKHYDRYAYLKEKSEALERWAEYLDGLLDPNKIVPLPKGGRRRA